MVSSPALITSSTGNVLLNKLAANVPNNNGRNPPVCSFTSVLIVSLIPFTNKPDSLSRIFNLLHLKL